MRLPDLTPDEEREIVRQLPYALCGLALLAFAFVCFVVGVATRDWRLLLLCILASNANRLLAFVLMKVWPDSVSARIMHGDHKRRRDG